MAKEMERQSRAKVDQNVDHDLDQGVDAAALLAQLLDQAAGPAQVVHGPEWTTQFRPSAIPGTINDKYTKGVLPLRALGFFLMWVTWDWKYGAFTTLVLGLILLIIKTR